MEAARGSDVEGQTVSVKIYCCRQKIKLHSDQFNKLLCMTKAILNFAIGRQHKYQGTKKFRSSSLGLVNFIVGLVEFILHLPDRQVKDFGEFFL